MQFQKKFYVNSTVYKNVKNLREPLSILDSNKTIPRHVLHCIHTNNWGSQDLRHRSWDKTKFCELATFMGRTMKNKTRIPSV